MENTPYLRLLSRQSVPQPSAQEYARTRVVVGHTPEMRVCPTVNPSTELVSGVCVGHFGGETERCAEPRASVSCGPMHAEVQRTYLRISVSGSLHSVDN